MSELRVYDENSIGAMIEEYLENSSISQDDYKKLKHENECLRQELHVLRLKLIASDALGKELLETNEASEQSLAQFIKKEEKERAKREERYRAEKEEYEKCIENLEVLQTKNTNFITELHKEIREYKDIINEKLQSSVITAEYSLKPFKEKIEDLTTLLENNIKEGEYLEEQLANMNTQYQDLKNVLKITKEQLTEKTKTLENIREELVMNRMELESLKTIPANETCKGNSLFAEVEDRRQVLLDKMKVLQDKYSEAKQALKMKTTEIRQLRLEKATMIRKLETNTIDTLQENANLLDKYKSRIFDLENKLKAEIKKNNELEEIQCTDDRFNFAQSLLAIKGRELKELSEKIEKQAMQMLVQEEANYKISLQLRHWQSKAIFMEAQLSAIKAQLETYETNSDNKKILFEAIENCKIANNAVDIKQICNDLKITFDNLLSKNNTCQQNSTEMSEKSVDKNINKQKDKEKVLHFATDTKDTEKKPLKKQPKQQDYPIINIADDS